MNQKTTRWSCLVGLTLLIATFGITGSVQASELWYYSYYGSELGDCWQTGVHGAESLGCDNVGPGFLEVPGRLVNGGIGQNVDLTPNGDYCSSYVGHVLNKKDPNNEGSATGFTTPTPYEKYQEWDEHNVCQANLTSFGEVVRSANCSLSTCGMHHYVSFKEQGYKNRPWEASFGSPSLVITTEADAALFSSSNPAGWGYVCPIFQDAQPPHNILEYCLQEWRGPGNEKPASEVEHIGTCALGPDSNNIDTVGTFFYPGTTFATQLAGSANTEVAKAGWKTYKVGITAQNLKNAIELDRKEYKQKPGSKEANPELGYGCGRAGGLSTEPKEYALIGIEQGAEAWSFSELGASEANLQVHDEYTQPPPIPTTEGFVNESENWTKVQGNANPEGSTTEVHFELGLTTSYGTSAGYTSVGSGLTPQSTSAEFKTVSNTLYHYRLVASNAGGTIYGEDHTFTSAGPAVETNEPNQIGETAAIVAGKLNPRGTKTQFSFEIGTTTSYGTTLSGGGVEYGGESWTAVTARAGELTPNTTYHYRIKAFDVNGNVSYGADRTFTTLNVCGGANITGQGSTLLNRAQLVWESGFNTSADAHACNGTQGSKGTPHVTYTVTDSGAGLLSWGVEGGTPSYGTTNAFIGTDEPPSAAQLTEIEAHETTLVTHAVETVPVVQAAIAIVVHLPANCVATSESAAGRLALNNSTLEGIFRGTITKWSQLTENGDKLTGTGCNAESAITKVVRRDRSGTTHILKKYLGLINTASFEREDKQTSTWGATAEGSTNTMWPKAAAVIRPAGNGDEELLKLVAQTPGSISYANLADARANTTFVPPTGGASTATFWTVIQNKTGTVTYADPASNKDVAAVGEANCSKEEYSNSGNPFPPESVTATWNTVTTETEEVKYTLCGLSYVLTFDRYSAFPGTTGGETATGNNFLRFVLDSAKEIEGNGNNGGQTLIKKHDYYELSSAIWKLAVKGGEAVKF